MITFGYKNKFSGALRALAAIVIGLLMLANTGWARICVQVVGAFLVASGLFSLFYGLQRKEEPNFRLLMVNAGIDLVLGLVMFFFAEGIGAAIGSALLVIIIVVLLLLALLQGIVLYSSLALMGTGFTLLLLPVSLLVFGVVLLFLPRGGDHTLVHVLAGAGLVVYGIFEILSSWKVEKAKAVEQERKAPSVEEVAKDVDYIKEEE
jgi:uncharacterized membrane protein HdeD (DUF308 family)